MERTPSQDEYFAAVGSDQIAIVLKEKVDAWFKYFKTTSHYAKLRKSWAMYYGLTDEGGMTSSGIREAGPRGEYALIMMNHYRNFLQHLLVLTTSQRPQMECQAANTDSVSMEQTKLGNALLDWYLRDKKVERYLKNAVECALHLGEGFISMDWEPSLGNMFAVNEDGSPVYEGDIAFENFTPIEIIRDPYRRDVKLPWVMVTRWKNKFDLAAQYPDLAEDILRVDPSEYLKLLEDFQNRWMGTDSDLIPEFTFFHERSPALPQGRVVKFLPGDLLLVDSPLPTEKVPVFRVSCGDQTNSLFGYTPGFDLLGPQEALNLLDSSALTNIKTFGVAVVKVPEGNNIQYSQLADGPTVITVNETAGKMEAVDLFRMPPEVLNFRGLVLTDMERISGVNSVVRGQPDTNISSGSFAALVASQAIQFNSGLQMSYTQLAEDVGSMIIELLQKFATTERVANIVGEHDSYALKKFSGQDIQEVKRVSVQVANPLMKTNAGRIKAAEDLLNKGLIQRPEQYLQVMESGSLKPMIEHEETELDNLRRENEMLRRGEQPIAIVLEDHQKHIREHLSVLNDPDARLEDIVRNATLAHIEEHIAQWQQADPALLQALGRMPLPVMAPMMPMGPEGAPPQGEPATGGPNANQMPEGPQMPQIAGTSERFEPVGGMPAGM